MPKEPGVVGVEAPLTDHRRGVDRCRWYGRSASDTRSHQGVGARAHAYLGCAERTNRRAGSSPPPVRENIFKGLAPVNAEDQAWGRRGGAGLRIVGDDALDRLIRRGASICGRSRGHDSCRPAAASLDAVDQWPLRSGLAERPRCFRCSELRSKCPVQDCPSGMAQR